ncbi:hypothetical protein GCM10010172_31530 [Paractinoplanes ferrugineus]|uniref:Uncharacterized protein n=1 Tax=Paractinoplanes ferrugineus TaxID=113564 RepID=A0A919J452_9ACTN|nr:hypothetical protein [Actinoplanes ferrugineus]GIE14155.1 hypothetical protein Afe05nite_59950 [Actinoplanes ferrugineus]
MILDQHSVVRLRGCFGTCVRAGQRQWRHLLAVAPERYLAAEAEEEKLRAQLGDVAILKERRAGVSRPLPLRELRRRVQHVDAAA